MSTNRLRRGFAVALAGVVTVGLPVIAITTAGPAHAQIVDTDAWYVIQSRHSGKVIEVANKSTIDGAMIQQGSRNDQAHQQFRFVASDGGYYRLQARHSGKVLDVWEWNAADGAEIRQWPDLDGTNQQFRLLDSDDSHVRLLNRFSSKVLDVWEWSTADGARISQFTDHDGANQQWRLIQVDTVGDGGDSPGAPGTGSSGLVGWATMNGGTTGGAGGSTVTVTNAAQLSDAVGSSSRMIIRVQGTINCAGMLRVRSDKSILGVGADATIAGCGLNINGDRNVIIRNIHFRDWDDDAVNVQESATNIWVDHNSFTNGYDGAVDIKRGSDFVTVSWNHFYRHDKTMLLGHSDSHTADTGHLRVTYHHNFFDGTNTRHPRVRFGNPVHVFNNYYRDNREYGVASTMGAGVLVEGNYFENVANPTHVGYAASGPGNLVFRDNTLVNSGTPETAGSVANIPYAYQLDNSRDVRSIVPAGAGAGRITP